MFENLRITLLQKGISMKQYAELLGVGDKTIQNKMSGKTDFTYPEFKMTCTLLSEYNADYLFSEKVAKTSKCERAS
ncbi:MAG: helix-turn-helix transcriptional regulator [Oscillospiraceae bacterium]